MCTWRGRKIARFVGKQRNLLCETYEKEMLSWRSFHAATFMMSIHEIAINNRNWQVFAPFFSVVNYSVNSKSMFCLPPLISLFWRISNDVAIIYCFCHSLTVQALFELGIFFWIKIKIEKSSWNDWRDTEKCL